MIVRSTRVAAIETVFHYADGATIRQSVREGDFGRRWRVGGTVTFDAPARAVPVSSIGIGFERPAWDRLLDIAVTGPPPMQAGMREALVIGAGLALLALSLIGNLLIAFAARRTPPVWNALWAGCVLAWALLWTQTLLFVAPAMAGTVSARLATLFSTSAIGCAIGFFLASAGGPISRRLRSAIAAVAVLVVLLGAIAAFCPGARLPMAASALNLTILSAAVGLTAICLWQWRRGNAQARDFLFSFTIPMLAVLWSIFADRGIAADDDGGMYLVLGACALQTVWLTGVVAVQLWAVRIERDAAQAESSLMTRLAVTDPLTGLLNRRGFVERVETLLLETSPVTLVLIDIDRFKRVNDRHGHDAGDAVLRAVAAALSWVPDARAIGRLGGEEFGLLAANLSPARAIEFANQARAAIAEEQVQAGDTFISVTASAGVSCVPAGTDFMTLYKAADRALYAAKDAGRDRAEIAPNLHAA
ncbi:diguanylate cyclase [Sphingomonas changnyeongensis]|uniref:diguanylate cyclase n=1 Tax=Sphingomonas changnyeongensis TaxID=2698679 RepID=A0A7Z2NXE3_9SPHN|nr:GGDEF domain-containing protein [Sphingomonas changnyeongensis]QHL91598.1 diguanylate cyclase [Sphingomonas changnyeongensis]